MRAVALAILATSLSQAPAFAADYGYDPGPLRGTEYIEATAAPIVSWEGPYFGGFGVSPKATSNSRMPLRTLSAASPMCVIRFPAEGVGWYSRRARLLIG